MLAGRVTSQLHRHGQPVGAVTIHYDSSHLLSHAYGPISITATASMSACAVPAQAVSCVLVRDSDEVRDDEDEDVDALTDCCDHDIDDPCAASDIPLAEPSTLTSLKPMPAGAGAAVAPVVAPAVVPVVAQYAPAAAAAASSVPAYTSVAVGVGQGRSQKARRRRKLRVSTSQQLQSQRRPQHQPHMQGESNQAARRARRRDRMQALNVRKDSTSSAGV